MLRYASGAAPGLVALALAGCTTPFVEDDVAGTIRGYYAAHAVEEAGACPRPEIATITHRRVVAAEGPRTRLRVRYGYFDPSVDEATDWDHVLLAERPCTGFAEREFTLLRRKTATVVVGMSGESREGG